MTAETVYAICFVVGLLFSVLSFAMSAGHLHLPGGLHMHGGAHMRGGGGGARGPSFFNAGTLAAFLAWFGGTGYLLTRYSNLWALLALVLAAVAGLIGAAVVFWFLFKILMADDRPLDPADYDMIGVLGRISSPIREGGVGEMIFSQEGVRRAAAVRSETGTAIARGTEVVVTQYKNGIAYVQPWEQMAEMKSASAWPER